MTMPPIRLFHIEVSNICNFRCDFCPLTVTDRTPQSMPLTVFRKIVDQVAGSRLATHIMLHVMGEPLLYPDVVAAVRHAAARGLKVTITTNGSLLNKDLICALGDNGLYSMDISLQLVGTDRHSSRHAGLTFDDYYRHVLQSIRLIREHTGIQLIVKVMNTVSRRLFSIDRPLAIDQQGREFREIVHRLITDIYRELGTDIDDTEITGRLGRANLNSAVRIRLHEKLFVFVQMFMDWGNALCDRPIHPAPFGSCSFAFTTPAVLSDGSVVICCADYDGHTALGHIDDGPLASILDSEKARYLWQGFETCRLRHPHCRKCLGSSNRFMAWTKGLGSIAVSRFMKLQGENQVIIR